MEKTSLKLVFLFSLAVIAFCSSLGDAREMMVEEEVNCIDGKCPQGKKNCNCLPPVAHIMDNNGRVCTVDLDCYKYCPPQCKFGTCACRCDIGCCTCTC
ncbi:PREDICTED: putative defensin-like protein 262 [Camelina sativa]|uniref:Defensin-like protein 262 n=1 Tax=Camelina sativa TaxID=90675 RepID=A0ABM1R442_CAMSA|nr:PREDICTED: putative defensin-like protein 262 [Camelina sativa]